MLKLATLEMNDLATFCRLDQFILSFIKKKQLNTTSTNYHNPWIIFTIFFFFCYIGIFQIILVSCNQFFHPLLRLFYFLGLKKDCCIKQPRMRREYNVLERVNKKQTEAKHNKG